MTMLELFKKNIRMTSNLDFKYFDGSMVPINDKMFEYLHANMHKLLYGFTSGSQLLDLMAHTDIMDLESKATFGISGYSTAEMAFAMFTLLNKKKAAWDFGMEMPINVKYLKTNVAAPMHLASRKGWHVKLADIEGIHIAEHQVNTEGIPIGENQVNVEGVPIGENQVNAEGVPIAENQVNVEGVPIGENEMDMEDLEAALGVDVESPVPFEERVVLLFTHNAISQFHNMDLESRLGQASHIV